MAITKNLRMKVLYYKFDPFDRFVDITLFDNRIIRVIFNSHTGLIYTRDKKDPLLSKIIQHKGLYVGICGNKHIILHNHIDAGTAEVVTLGQFSNEMDVFVDNKDCANDPISRVKIALYDAYLRKPYDLLTYNCQTLTNKACNNVTSNDDFAKLLVGGLGTLSVFALIGAVLSAND